MDTVRILLVDDDEDDYILTRDILREEINSQNYELSWCSDFSEAINAMLKSHYDVYLVDYRLGKESGIALLHEAIKSNCTEPIIMLTGKGDLKIDKEAMELGAADYLVKDDLTSQTLERSIRYAIAHSKTLQRLKSSETKFRILFERSKDPMLITCPDGTILEANPAALLFFESSLAELLKLKEDRLYADEADRQKFLKLMDAEGSVSNLELNLVTLTKQNKFCSLSSFLEVSQHANEERYYTIIHDLTFRLNQEKSAASTDKLAATERIAKSLSKEIQNPLSNINLALDELSDALNDQEQLVLADIIKGNCQRISALTSELLQSTDISSGLSLVETDLNTLIVELLEESGQELDIQVNYTPTEARFVVNAEADHLKSALKNILQNAAEAPDRAGGPVRLTLEHKAGEIRINISDNGSGITKDHLDKVFEPFFTTKPKALGMGLTRTQRIIDAHMGRVQIKSEPGTGTTISVFIPLYKVAAAN